MNRAELKAAVSRSIEARLDDWDTECSFRRQLSELVESVFQALDEESALMNIPTSAICAFVDGDSWIACRGDFVNLQQSTAGVGATREAAIADLERREAAKFSETMEKLHGR